MLIGYTDEMTDKEVAELADWADHHAKEVPNSTWKRAYALIREGADLLLRRRAIVKTSANSNDMLRKEPARSIECQTCYDEEGSFSCIKVAHKPRKRSSSYDHV